MTDRFLGRLRMALEAAILVVLIVLVGAVFSLRGDVRATWDHQDLFSNQMFARLGWLTTQVEELTEELRAEESGGS